MYAIHIVVDSRNIDGRKSEHLKWEVARAASLFIVPLCVLWRKIIDYRSWP